MTLTRRRSLAGLSAFGFMPNMAACQARGIPVIVIGAGIAGLSSARMLTDLGYQVTILEARNRIGGRIHTSLAWPDAPTDLGASWIHGVTGNPITKLARQAEVATVLTSPDNAQARIASTLRSAGITDLATDWVEEITRKALGFAEDQDQDLSLQAAIDAVSPPSGRTQAQNAQIRFHLATAFEQEFGGSSRQMSAWSIEDDQAFEGDDAAFPQGYAQIPNYLARGLDVRHHAVVKSVSWDENGVSVQLQNDASLRAKHVVVTLPLGVLQAGHVQFSPALPTRKQQSIDRLGVGLLNKLILRFDRQFWPNDFDWFEYLHDTPADWGEWVNLSRIGKVPCLMSFAGADGARAMERKTQSAILAEATTALRDMFGSGIPAPIAAQVTNWRQDPFALGAYSFAAVGSSRADRLALATPEANARLIFAGEAASVDYPGTVHGAYLSGVAAAQSIAAANLAG